tara:strand:- start:40341 stop:40532 length:192 start_codon:yes stop_codon:yes gene_type:complete
MTKLVNKDKVDLSVYDGDARVTIPAGGTADVDGRKNWDENPFVMAGLLQVVEDKPKADTKPKK